MGLLLLAAGVWIAGLGQARASAIADADFEITGRRRSRRVSGGSRGRRSIPLFSGLLLIFCWASIPAQALLILDFPSADDLKGPVFVQPFAGLAVVDDTGGVGRTESFFSDLPDGSLPGNRVVNILGNFQAFDSMGSPTTFDILGVEVTDLGSTFTPAFGEFNFAGRSSVTFEDSLDFDSVTFSAGDFTLAFTFNSDPALDYRFALLTDLAVNSFLLFDDVETSVPAPGTLLLFGLGFVALLNRRRPKR